MNKKNSQFSLDESDERLTFFPIKHQNLYDHYENARRCYWTPNEIMFASDAADFGKLSPDEKFLLLKILTFFAAGDGIVNVNIVGRFLPEIGMREAEYFYRFQAMMEDIHAEVYSLMLSQLCTSAAETKELFSAFEKDPVVRPMTEYMFAAANSEDSLQERLLRFACVEGIFFSGCFFAIYWFQSRGLLKGLGHANEFIARDEALHTIFAIDLILMCKDSLSTSRTKEIIREAVEVSAQFTYASLPRDLLELSQDVVIDYTRTIADVICKKICGEEIFGTRRHFHFMTQINLLTRTNYFERRPSDYSRAAGGQKVIEIGEDF